MHGKKFPRFSALVTRISGAPTSYINFPKFPRQFMKSYVAMKSYGSFTESYTPPTEIYDS